MDHIHFHGRIVGPITSEEGQRDYYKHLDYCDSCVHNTDLRKVPTIEDANEYLKLKAENPSLSDSLAERKRFRKLQIYKNSYDWRPRKYGEPHFWGLEAPDGTSLLLNIFADVFTQFDAINMAGRPAFVPVSNGKGWALASLSMSPVLLTEFQYETIIPERWEQCLFFVQDKVSKKWGALLIVSQPTNDYSHDRHTRLTIETIMPCIADAIYEDEFMVEDPEEMPSLFFMTRIGDKVGVLTDFGYSKIIYDTYECDSEKCSFRLIRHDRTRARCADWWHPDGKNLFVNLKRRKM